MRFDGIERVPREVSSSLFSGCDGDAFRSISEPAHQVDYLRGNGRSASFGIDYGHESIKSGLKRIRSADRGVAA
jgi:hypothetical protein